MHPAYSVIIFTCASGAGYGLLTWLAAAALFGALPAGTLFRVVAFGLALVLVVGGLLSSTAHLGRPERAWRAFSQWRTSWLSREGVAAVATFLPFGMFAVSAIALPGATGALQAAAAASLFGAVVTVWCTGMIYASLRTVPAWNLPLVAPGYVAIALGTGGVLFVALAVSFATLPAFVGWLTIVALAAAALVKWTVWTEIETTPRRWTVEAATGLGRFGKVRPLEPPHTQANFVMREMGYQVARKHVAKLRPMILLMLAVVPSAFLALILAFGGVLAPLWAVLAVAAAAIGVLTERWLFFAEAQHVVTVYYGADAA